MSLLKERDSGGVDVEIPFLPKDTPFQYPYLFLKHTAPAIILTLVRLFIGSGMSLFNFQKTMQAFGVNDGRIVNIMAYVVMISSAVDTLSGRGVSNFLRCLPPAIYLSDEDASKMSFDVLEDRFPMFLLQETYVIFFDQSECKLYRRDDKGLKTYPFDKDGQEKLDSLYHELQQKACDDVVALSLSLKQIQLFSSIKSKKEPPVWGGFTIFMYWSFYLPAATTAIFSSLAAILYLYTFAEKFESNLYFVSVFVGSGVVVNFLTYCFFNLCNINQNIVDVCNKYERGLPWLSILFGEENNTSKALMMTGILATAGMLGNLSGAFYVMEKLLDVPAAQLACKGLHFSTEDMAITLAILNVYASFFSGFFNMVINAHRLMIQPKIERRSYIDILISLNTFFNASVNAMQAFLGAGQWMGQDRIDWHSGLDLFLFGIRMTITFGFVFLTYGMARQGNERMVHASERYFNQYACFYRRSHEGYQHLGSATSLSRILSEV